ncbi:hypothetical protein H0G86_009760 [Trichoderma simmonsii]|uniref:Uncharacterized protein n=1 Tax=Trichoderma simmonsii TaxID=1491479 RepID=A0A8G0PJD9_9HYPO|nr:hypothetical protein H0G86_009760 [Trichoderma simmonsii]
MGTLWLRDMQCKCSAVTYAVTATASTPDPKRFGRDPQAKPPMQAETKQARGIRLWRCAVFCVLHADGSPEGKRRNEKIFQLLLHVGTREERMFASWFVRDAADFGGSRDGRPWPLFGDRRLPAANGRPDSGTAQPHTLPAIWALACIVLPALL